MTGLQGLKTFFGHVMKTLLVDELSTCLSREPLGEERWMAIFWLVPDSSEGLFPPPVPPVGETLKTTRLTWLMKTKVKELGAIGQQQVSLCWLTADFQPIHCGVAVIIILAFICLNPSVYWGFQENPHLMNMMCDGATVKDYLLMSMSFLFHLSLSFAYILTSLSMHLYQICLYRGNVDVLKLSNRWPALLRLWTSNLSN